jgi:hypothetical protein
LATRTANAHTRQWILSLHSPNIIDPLFICYISITYLEAVVSVTCSLVTFLVLVAPGIAITVVCVAAVLVALVIAITVVCVAAVLHSNVLLAAIFPFNQTQAQCQLGASAVHQASENLLYRNPPNRFGRIIYPEGGKRSHPQNPIFRQISFSFNNRRRAKSLK